MLSGVFTQYMQAPEERSVATTAPFATRLARPTNVLGFSDAVAPPREEVLFEGGNRHLSKVDGRGDQQERIRWEIRPLFP